MTVTTEAVPPETAPWPDDMVLTEAHAEWLMDRGACNAALGYVGWTVAAFVKDAAWDALKYAPDRLTDKQVATAARRSDPWVALKYAHNRLPDKQFVATAKAAPLTALRFAPDRYRRLCATATTEGETT